MRGVRLLEVARPRLRQVQYCVGVYNGVRAGVPARSSAPSGKAGARVCVGGCKGCVRARAAPARSSALGCGRCKGVYGSVRGKGVRGKVRGRGARLLEVARPRVGIEVGRDLIHARQGVQHLVRV